MAEPDKYLVQLRRELTKSQARLARAERERDRALEENAALRKRLSDKNVAPPRKTRQKTIVK
jgi:hypothetical protein